MINKELIGLAMGICIVSSCQEGKELKAGYEGKDLTEVASIISNKNTMETILKIETDGEWKLYSGSSVTEINFQKPVSQGHTRGEFPLNVPTDSRSYFELITSDGQAILAERHLPLKGGI